MDDRPLPMTDPESWYPDRMIPIHDDRHCPGLNDCDDPEYVDGFTAGSWDGWLGFLPGRTPPGDAWTSGYNDGRLWGVRFAADGSPW